MTLYTTLIGLTKKKLMKIISMPFKQVVLHVADKDGYANIPVTDEYLELLEIIINAKKKDGTPFVDNANCQSEPHPKVLEKTKEFMGKCLIGQVIWKIKTTNFGAERNVAEYIVKEQ